MISSYEEAARHLEEVAGETRFGKNEVIVILTQSKDTGVIDAHQFVTSDEVRDIFPMIGALTTVTHTLTTGCIASQEEV